MTAVEKMERRHIQRKVFWRRAIWQAVLLILISTLLAFSYNRLRNNKFPLIPKETTYNESPHGLVISLEEAKELFYDHSTLFLDARPKEFYDLGHIAGARNLPFEEFEKLFPEVMKDIDKNTLIITYCDGEHCQLSRELALALMNKGYTNVYVLENGWTVWKEANLPIEKSKTDNLTRTSKRLDARG